MRKTEIGLDSEKLEAGAEVLRALTHPLRIRILTFIHDNDRINVNQIYSSLDLEQSITSQHLRILRKAGLVGTERDGKFIYYFIHYDRIASATEAINQFHQHEVDTV